MPTAHHQPKRDLAAWAGIILTLLGIIVSGAVALGRVAQRIDSLERRITANSQRLQNQSEQTQMLDQEVTRIRAQQEILHHLN